MPDLVPVTVENFARAESDMYFASAVRDAGGIGRLRHYREVMPVDRQTVVRPNRDTLYSSGVFDLDAGPVTITMPDAGKRFMSLQVISEDHYVPLVAYGGEHTLEKERVGTRYVMAGVRTLVDPLSPEDLDQVHDLQDAIRVEQANPGRFEIPPWDQASQKKIRDALLVLSRTVPDSKRMFGAKDKVDPVRHLIGIAFGWGGNPEEDATYVNVTPARNDGTTVHRFNVRDVPVDGFWSVSVYNASGYFEPNDANAYTINHITAKKEPDNSVVVQFGGCNGHAANCLPIMPGWNYTVRLYRPRAEILTGRWTFPEAKPVEPGAAGSAHASAVRTQDQPRVGR